MQSYNDFLFTKGKGSEVIKKRRTREKGNTQTHRVKKEKEKEDTTLQASAMPSVFKSVVAAPLTYRGRTECHTSLGQEHGLDFREDILDFAI